MEQDTNEPTQETTTRLPWVTVTSTLACIVIYLGLAASNDYESLDNLRRWGYVDAHSIWDGAYWGLLSSCFVHFAFIHLAFNVYWLWVLGGRFELEYGSVAYLLFFVFAGFISSSLQLAFSDATGIGASGVGYALFGFAFFARSKTLAYASVLDDRMVTLWIAWLFGCMVTTYLGIFPIGNVAHVSGMLFGGLIAAYFLLNKKIVIGGITAMVVLSWMPLFWSPWSTQWISFMANKSHMNRDYTSAVDYYSRIIGRDPDAAWAIWNRGCVYHDLGQFDKSSADLERAKSIDPDVENLSDR